MLRFFFRFIKMLVCILIVVAISATRDHKIMGYDLQSADKGQTAVNVGSAADTATITFLPTGEMVVNSTSIAKDVKGYAGPIPLKVFIKDGVIEKIQPLSNTESQWNFECIKKELIPKYIGKKVDEAMTMDVDAVSGSTYSSRGVKGTMQRVLQCATKKQAELNASPVERVWNSIRENNNTPGLIAALIVSLMAAILPLFIKSKGYRTMQQVLDVAVLGIWTGSFVNYTTLTGCTSNGISLSMPLALIILIIIAFLYPVFGKKVHYCNWCCPMGATQDLAYQWARKYSRTGVKILTVSPKAAKRLKLFRLHVWMMLMFLSWFGITSEWMNYEIFSAFIWQSAQWFMIAFLLLTIALSIFTPRPYCRFLCPTGTLIR